MIAVTGKSGVVLHDEFGLLATGRHEEIAESPIVGADLPNGTYLMYLNGPAGVEPDNELFARISSGAFLVVCGINESLMTSYVCAWKNETRLWSVFHDGEQGVGHLDSTGNVPDQLQSIRDRLFEIQDSDDDTDFVFDIPIELFVAHGGIRYNQDIPGGTAYPWQVLEWNSPN